MQTTELPPPKDYSSPDPSAPTPAWDDALLASPHTVADKRRRVQRMFAAIAPSYDLNNRLHSLGIDQLWRKKTVQLAAVKTSDTVIDVACGTGDLSFAFRPFAGACHRRRFYFRDASAGPRQKHRSA